MIPVDPVTLLAAAVAVCLAAGVQTLSGAGFGLTAAPPLLLVAPTLVPDTLLWLSVAVTAYTAWLDRAAVDRVFVRRCVIAALPGMAAGAVAVALLPGTALAIGIATVVIIAGCAGLAGLRVPDTAANTRIAGFLAGALNWAVALPGPPVVLVYRADAAALRATLSLFFCLVTVMTLAARYAGGLAHRGAAAWAAVLMVAVLTGALAARPLTARLSAAWVQRSALLLATGSGVALLLRSMA